MTSRTLTPVARSSYVWQDYDDERSAVERVNSRLAGRFGFERPGIGGLAKMQLRVITALTIVLAQALGRIRAGTEPGPKQPPARRLLAAHNQQRYPPAAPLHRSVVSWPPRHR